ncbi:MAG: hypothetical protein LAT64_13640 [Phycisphaerales bacterium]|nr:hypothetical protein [Planctomycetota bacterium]MCH8509796.1 hypothetical protein [Phycisphaerales bacterium]
MPGQDILVVAGIVLVLLAPAVYVHAWAEQERVRGLVRRRGGRALCVGCGYPVRSDGAGACPECGLAAGALPRARALVRFYSVPGLVVLALTGAALVPVLRMLDVAHDLGWARIEATGRLDGMDASYVLEAHAWPRGGVVFLRAPGNAVVVSSGGGGGGERPRWPPGSGLRLGDAVRIDVHLRVGGSELVGFVSAVPDDAFETVVDTGSGGESIRAFLLRSGVSPAWIDERAGLDRRAAMRHAAPDLGVTLPLNLRWLDPAEATRNEFGRLGRSPGLGYINSDWLGTPGVEGVRFISGSAGVRRFLPVWACFVIGVVLAHPARLAGVWIAGRMAIDPGK